MSSRHSDRAFEQDLRDLRDKLLAMGGKVEGQIAESMRALAERDTALAQKVQRDDAEVNRLELEIDELCRRILALRHPAASDLRLITTALKIVVDLERIGDLAVNVAERALDLNQVPPLKPYVDLPRMADLAQKQIAHALDAFVRADVAIADQVLKGDEEIDAIFLKVFNELIDFMTHDPQTTRRATSLMFVAKHLERVGDHAMNVAEMVIYMVRGTDVRHPRSRAASPG